MKLYLERDAYNLSSFSFNGCPNIFGMKSLNRIGKSIIKKRGQCEHFKRNSSLDLHLRKGSAIFGLNFQVNTPHFDLPIILQTIFLKSTKNWIEIVCNHTLSPNGYLDGQLHLNQMKHELCSNKVYKDKMHVEMKTEQLVIELVKDRKTYDVELYIDILTKIFSVSQFHPFVKWKSSYYFEEQSKYSISVPGALDYIQMSLTEASKIGNHCLTFYFKHKETHELKTARYIAEEEKEDFSRYQNQFKTPILDQEYFVYKMSSKRRKGRTFYILNWCSDEGPEVDPLNFMWSLYTNPRYVFLPTCLEREVISTNLRSWNNVSDICEKFGGRLPYFNDRAEIEEFILLLDLFDKTYPREAVYIGLNYYKSKKVRVQIYSKN